MKMRKKFTLSNILMFLTPILLIGVITVLFLGIFIAAFPAREFNISKLQLFDFRSLMQYIGVFIAKNPQGIMYIVLWLLLCVMILFGTVSIISLTLSKSIIEPIHRLTRAAENIKNGNLDFEVLHANDDDINNLCVMFDEMRKNLKTSRQREQRLKKERSLMLANLSHDLKTPITSIQGYIKGIQEGVADTPEKVDKYLKTIASKASAIDEMVNNLSTFSKLELDKIQFHFEISDLHAFLRELLDELRFDTEKSDVLLTYNLPEAPAYIKIDYEKMYRVFSNLINNSVKYKREGTGHIFVNSRFEHNGILISIQDDGIGIADKEIEKVFDSFYRIDPARNLNVKGSGLGLGIARQIVEMHGGKLWFQSGAENGANAFLYFPLRSTEQEDV